MHKERMEKTGVNSKDVGRRRRSESLLHSASLWQDMKVGPYAFHLLDLDHPDVAAAILDEIDSCIDVYYDRRWEVTGVFCKFLLYHPEWVAGRSVMVLGAGVGVESLVIGRLEKKMFINDWDPVALELCGLQLMNEPLPPFKKFLRTAERPRRTLLTDEMSACLLFE